MKPSGDSSGALMIIPGVLMLPNDPMSETPRKGSRRKAKKSVNAPKQRQARPGSGKAP